MACMTVEEQRVLAALSPMWTRIERGEVDLSQYTDDEILTARITMADGRLLPAPTRLPDTFVAEQQRRGFLKVQRTIREGAVKAPEVLAEIMDDDQQPAKARIDAAKEFLNRFIGTATQHVHVTGDQEADPRDVLLQRLMAARQAVATPVQPELPMTDVHEAVIVEDTIELEDLL